MGTLAARTMTAEAISPINKLEYQCEWTRVTTPEVVRTARWVLQRIPRQQMLDMNGMMTTSVSTGDNATNGETVAEHTGTIVTIHVQISKVKEKRTSRKYILMFLMLRSPAHRTPDRCRSRWPSGCNRIRSKSAYRSRE